MSLDSRIETFLSDWKTALEQAGLADPLEESPLDFEQVWSSSEFVARACIRNPGLLHELIQGGSLERAYEPGEMSGDLYHLIDHLSDEDALGKALRQFRNQQMVRIIWRDLARYATLSETLEELSELADISIRLGLEKLYEWACEKDGAPRDSEGEAQQLYVIGMGKLGARELNLSSDIDLIFAYPSAGETDNRRPISNEQFFTRLGRKLISLLSTNTAEGFVFRVDMRLRPFGDVGPLASNFDALEIYYQSQARDWERYAMVKARVITGSEKGRNNLMSIIRPFVYRRYLDYGAIDAIRRMKRMIEGELHKKGMDANIKLGAGGIREIEFIGQAFQLIRGGREKGLQIRGIQPVLEYLGNNDLLPDHAVSELMQAYVFLRLTENRLQAWNDEQTHLLPDTDERKTRLALSMGFDDWEVFSQALKQHRHQVHEHFQDVFEAPQVEAEHEETIFQKLWFNRAEPHELLDLGFDDIDKVVALLTEFQKSAAYSSLTKQAEERMSQLMPLMLEALAGVHSSEATLKGLLKLMMAIMRRTAYLDLMVENPPVISQLVRLASESIRVIGQLQRQPLLLDELLDARRLYSPLRREGLDHELDTILGQVDREDLEQQMERLRQFAQSNMLRVAAADIADVIPMRVVSDYLTEIAEAVMAKIVDLAYDYSLEKYGHPGGVGEGSGFAVIGYGKLGGIELGYGSDLDLVFLHGSESASAMTSSEKPVANDVFYARMAQRMIHLLTTRTPAGILYEVDMRLRPNGQSGMLVSSLGAFERYQENDAWTWEHQALLRARPIAGDPSVIAKFEAIRRQVLSSQRDKDKLREEVISMREKMRESVDKSTGDSFDLKQGHGGIVDIEFMVQYAVLRWSHQYPDLLDWTDNLRLLEGLARHELLEGKSAELLANAYQVFRAVSHRNALQEKPAVVSADKLIEERQLVLDIWAEMMESPGKDE